MNYVIYPDGFEEYAWELYYKGHFQAQAVVDGNLIDVNFYDKHRLQQDTKLCEEIGNTLFAKNIIVVTSVDKQNMDAAIQSFRP